MWKNRLPYPPFSKSRFVSLRGTMRYLLAISDVIFANFSGTEPRLHRRLPLFLLPQQSPYPHRPDGESTRVRDDGNGTYTIIGGDLNDEDYNIYVYSKDEEGNYTIKGESIGVTTSLTSFYDSDSEAWAVDSKINLQDTSGSEFLENIFSDTPTLDIYIPNATNNSKYDFKGSKDELGNEKDHYRGMSIGKDSKGQNIITSARDIGNIAAGYVSGANGLSWAEARLGFDLYQSYKNKELTTEGMSTQNAQRLGFLLGSQRPELVKMFRKSYGFIKLVNHFKNNCNGLFLQK